MKPGWTLEFLAGYVAGLRAAAKVVASRYTEPTDIILCADTIDVCEAAILARAQELDPK